MAQQSIHPEDVQHQPDERARDQAQNGRVQPRAQDTSRSQRNGRDGASDQEQAAQVQTAPGAVADKVPSILYTYLIASVAALGGLLFGYDTGVISGAELFLKKDFHLTAGSEELAVSAVLIGAVIGAAIGGPLVNWLGRKIALIIMAVIFGVCAIPTAIASDYGWVVAFRIFVGVAIGASSIAAPIYVAEMAPPNIRGRLVTFFQLAITIGIAVAFWVDLAFSAGGYGWRPMFGAALVPAVILGVGMLFLSDTPRWLASKGRWDQATAVATQTSGGEKAKDEIADIRKSLEAEEHSSVRDLLRPGLRIALMVGVGLAIFQQFVGINTVIYYAPTIFQFAGYKTSNAAILATAIVGIDNVLSTVIAVVLLDRMGRRFFLLTGLVGIVLSLAAMGYIFAIGPKQAGLFVLIALLVYIFSFAISMGPAFWLLSAEIFPNRLRGSGASIATAFEWGANLLVSITFLTLINVLGKSVTFWVYAVIGILAIAFTWFFVPETKGRRLEKIEQYWQNGMRWEATEGTAGAAEDAGAVAME
ncbi:MAG: sugar porter family MFS transporter [Ktedonobacterales bacterium]